MLLTSSQISMGISSIIVFIFSTILFLSGYILQQQTVRDLESILKPAPEPAAQDIEAIEIEPDNVDWDKNAYVQILQDYRDVCSAAIIFAELSRQGSKAKRVLLYPRTWDRDDSTNNRLRERNLRLLRKVATRYNIFLRPTDVESDTLESPPILPVNRLWSLIHLESIVHLNPSGVIYDAAALDQLFTMDPIVAGLHFLNPEQDEQPGEDQPVAIMAKPSMTTYQSIKKLYPPSLSLGEMTQATGSTPQYSSRLFGETSSYNNPSAESEDVQANSAYIRFTDPDILGPEYDMPHKQWNAARPADPAHRAAWEGFYTDYRAQRRAVCGLDVEPMPKIAEVHEQQEIMSSAATDQGKDVEKTSL